LIKKKLKLTVQVSCLFYFLLGRFFQRKMKKWVLLVFFKWAFLKKTRVGFFGSGFFTTTLTVRQMTKMPQQKLLKRFSENKNSSKIFGFGAEGQDFVVVVDI